LDRQRASSEKTDLSKLVPSSTSSTASLAKGHTSVSYASSSLKKMTVMSLSFCI
jgi:hypothetical protein